MLYAPAKDYDVLISYKGKTGIVTKMAFVRRAPGQPAPAAKDAPAKTSPAPAGGS